MKQCQDIRPELSAYLDGELTPPQRTDVEAHLASCPRCQQALAELKTLATGVAALPRLVPAPQFLAEVRRKIARGDQPEPMTWQDHLFRPVWLKVPLEAAALIVIAALLTRLMEVEPAMKVATATRGAEQPLDALAKNEPPSAPVSDKSAVEIRRRAMASNGGTDGLTIAPPLAAPDVAVVARGLGIEPSRLGDIVVVPAKDLHDVQGRAEQLAAKCNGKVIPVPPSKEAAGHLFFVELPREYAASFKLELLQASRSSPSPAKGTLRGDGVAPASATATSGARIDLGAGVLIGNRETNAAFDNWSGLALSDEAKARASATTILEIMVVTPTN